MLTRLTLRNFRGFENHELPLRDMTVIVGRNNAGKSTVVEALRLVSIVVARYRRLGFYPGPEWILAGRANFGVRPSLRNTEISFNGMFHHYNDPPAVITAEFDEGQSVTIYIADEDRFHAVIRDKHGQIVRTREKAIAANIPTVSIMPQVAPVQKREVILSEDYVRGAMSSVLAPLHFRNQLRIRNDLYGEFRRLVRETWPGVSIQEFIAEGSKPGDRLHLEIRNEDFVGEIGLMGHGLQMWLQTMWFLTLSRDSETVILDEPDVYMHPDLQRRIIRFLRNRHAQCVITTHSVEVLSEVKPEDVLIVDKRRSQSHFAASMPAVQRLIDKVGSVHNISLARLWHARKLILVEGKDLTLLKAFQDTWFPDSSQPIDASPSMPIGGWGGWQYAVGSAMLLQNAVGEDITTYCFLDSDYHTAEEISVRYKQAQERNVQLHIWSQEEIENYLLCPDAIQRVIEQSLPKRAVGPTSDEVYGKLLEIADSMKDEVTDGLATEILARERKLAVATANKGARDLIESARKSSGNILSLVSGKTVISRLSEWSQREFGVQISSIKLARQMRQSEIAPELREVITAVETQNPFASGASATAVAAGL
jgi:energy-coupling factor transporter ATP-binding protein EcfA2